MPSAPDWLRDRWRTQENGIGPEKALAYLKDSGRFVEDRNSGRLHPATKEVADSVTEEEGSALDFLFYEWDYSYYTEPLKVKP